MNYSCIFALFLGFWIDLYLPTNAGFQQNILSDFGQVMHLKSNKSGRLINSKLHLVPGSLSSIHTFSSSNVLLCIFDIIKRWKETHAIIIYRSEEDYDLLNSSFVMKQRNVEIEVLKWQEDGHHINEIQQLQRNLRSFVVVCCETFLAQEFLQMMGVTGAFTTNRNILIVSEDDSPILRSSFQFIVTSHLSLLIPEPHQGDENVDIHRTINFDVLDVFNNYVDDENKLVNGADFKIHQLQFREILIMKWSLFKGLLPLDVFKFNPNTRMNAKTIQAGLINYVPFTYVDMSKGCVASKGYIKEIFDILADNLNFRMNVSCASKHTTGNKLDNGTFTGIMKMVAEKEIDVGLAPMVMTDWRSQLTRVPYLLQQIQATIWFRRENTGQSVSSKTHFSAFPLDVWLVFAVTCLSIAFTIALVLKINPLKITNYKINLPYHTKVLLFLRWFLCGEFLEQALEFAPGISTKILLGTFNATITLIFLHYTSIFSSVLTTQTVTLPFTNIEELLDNNNYRIGIRHSTGFQYILKEAHDDLFKKIWWRMSEREDNLVSDAAEGLRKVCNEEKFAFFFDDQSTAQCASSREFDNCGLNFMKLGMLEEFIYIPLRSDFPYSVTFSNVIIRMKESGILGRLESAYNSDQVTSITKVKSNEISRQYSNAIFSFDLSHILIPIGVLAGGIILSLFVLLLEVTVSKLQRISNQNQTLEVIRRSPTLWKSE